MTLILPPRIVGIRHLLESGRYAAAAAAIRRFLPSASIDELRDVAALQANALEGVGDKRPRRRPTRQEKLADAHSHGKLFTAMLPDIRAGNAAGDLLGLILARHVVDGDPVGPHTLARLMHLHRIQFDDEPELPLDELLTLRASRLSNAEVALEVRAHLLPIVSQELKARGFDNVKRKGFRSVFRRRVAAEHRVPEEPLRSVAPEVSE